MAILASFIGIDKYINPHISDLGGACRDATALWALFSDTIPDINATLVVNAEADVTGVRAAMDKTLGAAGPDDTVILSFAGHGTHDHRLVTHNTTFASYTDTTISMEELAMRFKKSNAKAILFILDCCFSGGAPARVLDDCPISRDSSIPLTDLAGKGRILIAASNIDEPAWEHPGSRHGLLTKAIIDVLQMAQDSVNLPTAMDQVMERVRIEADRMGVSQTPIFFGFVEGGLVVPALRPGSHFYTAFPEVLGIKIGSKIEELSSFGLPKEILTEWSNQFKAGLNDLQLQTVNDYRILEGESLLVVAPTSSGKTFIGEMAATRAITEGRKAVFLLPYRALVNEKYEQFSALYGERLNMRVIRCTGDYLDQTEPFIRGKYDLALLTFEMFLNLAVSNPTLLNQVGLVVLDEAQFITDPHRGIVVELLLTYLLAAQERGIIPQLIALSAVIGGANDFDTWLGCKQLITHKRPVPLVEGVLDRSGMFQYMDTSGDTKLEQLLPTSAICIRRDKPSAQDMIVPLVQMLVQKGEKVIVFRNIRGSAQGCAAYLSKDLNLPPAIEVINDLPSHDLTSTSIDLRSCLKGGTAFHNTNLTREEKAVVERAFRDSKSKVRVLAATTTLAAGINTPASTVILAEQEFIGEEGRPFTVAEYKNMAGRAGRLGFNEEGKTIILADNSYERELLFNRYITGKLEMFHSSFDPKNINTWMVRLLAQVERVLRQDVVRLLANTYGGYLANRLNPKWRTDTKVHLEELLERMIRLGLVEEMGDFIQLTLLGRACGRSALSFDSTLRLVDLLKKVQPNELTAERLIAMVQALPESDNGYTPVMKKGQAEMARQREAVQRYGPDIVRALQNYTISEFDYYARCKRAAILWDWVNGVPMELIEKTYSTTPFQGRIGYGDVRRFADATRFHLRSAYHIANVMFLGEGPGETSIEAILKQLEVGIPTDALELLAIPLPLERGEYLTLYHKGLKTLDDIWSIPKETIKEILGSVRSDQLESFRTN